MKHIIILAAVLTATVAAAHAQEVTTVYIGGANAINPSSFLGENGQLDGYDIDVLKAADALLEDYAFEYQPFEFTGLFAALDTGRIDLAAASLQPNAERAEKYIFSVGYMNSNSYVTFLDGRTDITALSDLAGKSVEVWSSGSADFLYFTAHNENNPDAQVEIVRGPGDPAVIVKNLIEGRTDAYVANHQTRDRMSAQFNVALDYLPEPTQVGSNVFILRTDQVELQQALDAALRELAANGTLTELSVKWFGSDYSQGATGDQ